MSYQRRHSMLPRGNHRTIGFWVIYPLSIIFIFHSLLVAYINSTYIEQHIGVGAVATIYSIGSVLAILAFLFFTRALRTFGNVGLTLALSLIDIISLIIIGVTDHKETMIVAFVLFMAVNPLIFLSIDIFSESLIGNDESSTGSKRGLTLALMSVAAVIAPLAMSSVVEYSGGTNLSNVYFASALIFVPFLIIILARFRNFKDPHYKHSRVGKTLYEIWHLRDVRNVLLSHFSLQLFFAWMTIYVPLYLVTKIGFSWDTIGSIIAVGLLAYVICEWPIGILADKWWGEKEMMAAGFLILAIVSAAISFISDSVLAWMVLFFISRVGASLVEATTESYFFKHMKGGNAGIISFFRLLRPLSILAGSMLGALALFYLPFKLIFVVLGIFMIPGIFFTLALKDTK